MNPGASSAARLRALAVRAAPRAVAPVKAEEASFSKMKEGAFSGRFVGLSDASARRRQHRPGGGHGCVWSPLSFECEHLWRGVRLNCLSRFD